MQINNIHIDEEEFDLFCNLEPKEKIGFLSDTMAFGVDTALDKIAVAFEAEQSTSTSKEIVNALFQDTMYEEQTWNDEKLHILLINNSIHLNCSSLKWIRRVVTKLFMDGHVIVKNKLAKKIPGIDKFKYYRCYDILGQVPPICLS